MSDNHKAVTIVERVEPPQNMSPVVAAGMAILQQSPSPETLRELLAVQRDWEKGEARKAFTRALVDLKRDLPAIIAKDATVDFTSPKGRTHYRHSSLAGVLDAVVDPMSRHGFSHSWVPSTTANGVTVICRLTHSAGHSEETTISAPFDLSGGKNAVQGVGSTITYLQRYTLLAILGIATGDMPEPTGEEAPDPSRIDTDRNLRAAAGMKKLGRTPAEAVAYIGKPVSEWTTEDLDKLREWAKPAERAPQSAELQAFCEAVSSSKSEGELKAIIKHAENLAPAEKEEARAMYRHRLDEIKRHAQDTRP